MFFFSELLASVLLHPADEDLRKFLSFPKPGGINVRLSMREWAKGEVSRKLSHYSPMSTETNASLEMAAQLSSPTGTPFSSVSDI